MQEEQPKQELKRNENIFKKPWVQSLSVVVVIFVLLGGFLLWQSKANTVFIDDSLLQAPLVDLSPTAPGTLNALYVKEGDNIAPNTQVALVGSQTITSSEGGLVASAPNLLGQYFSPGETVVSVVDQNDMQVVGSLDETKGLKNIIPGQRATFTVDAFPGKVYQGVVADVTPSAIDTGVVFSISDDRPVQQFSVKVNFNVAYYPELRNGMSAKITVYTK